MGTTLTLVALVALALFLFFVLTASGSKKPESGGPTNLFSAKGSDPAPDRELEVIQAWYKDSKEKEFKANVLKDLASRAGPAE